MKLKHELKLRLGSPLKQETFCLYFIGLVMIAGSFGVWEPLFRCFYFHSLKQDELLKSIVGASYSYFVAVAATASVDIQLGLKPERSTRVFLSLCALGVAACAVLAAFGPNPYSSRWPALIGVVLSLFLWWIANGENPNLQDNPPTSTLGGKTTDPLAGGTNGINVQG